MAKLNLDKFKENADKIIQEKSTQGLFSESQNRLLTLELDLLHESPFRVHLNNSKLENLTESIESVGQLEPITITKHKESYQVLNGHSRLEAIKQAGGESALCMLINISDDDMPYYPYILNQTNKLDEFEVAYYIDRLLSSGEKEKTIHKKIGLISDNYTRFNFEYNLFEILKNSDVISYEQLKDISKISNESLRDETLDHIVQKLITDEEIKNYLLKVKEEELGAKFALKIDGIRIKKNGPKTSIDLDERYLDFNDTKEIYNFIEFLKNR